MGRPPVQHIKHVHTLALSPELEEKIDEAINKRMIGMAVRGVFSSNVGAGFAVAAILFVLVKLGYPQKEIQAFVGWITGELTAIGVSVGHSIGSSFASGVTEPVEKIIKDADIAAQKAWCRFNTRLREFTFTGPNRKADFQEALAACERIGTPSEESQVTPPGEREFE